MSAFVDPRIETAWRLLAGLLRVEHPVEELALLGRLAPVRAAVSFAEELRVAVGVGVSLRRQPEHVRGGRRVAREHPARGHEHTGANLAQSMAPSEVAAKLVEELREDRFYIFTHGDDFAEPIRARMERVLARQNPLP